MPRAPAVAQVLVCFVLVADLERSAQGDVQESAGKWVQQLAGERQADDNTNSGGGDGSELVLAVRPSLALLRNLYVSERRPTTKRCRSEARRRPRGHSGAGTTVLSCDQYYAIL